MTKSFVMRATLAHAWSRRSANTNLRDTSSGVAQFSYLGRVNGDRHVEVAGSCRCLIQTMSPMVTSTPFASRFKVHRLTRF
jgi:hypothetical protein